jgi:hypothetical protein
MGSRGSDPGKFEMSSVILWFSLTLPKTISPKNVDRTSLEWEISWMNAIWSKLFDQTLVHRTMFDQIIFRLSRAVAWVAGVSGRVFVEICVDDISAVLRATDLRFRLHFVSSCWCWCHGSTAAAMPTVVLDDPGSNPGVNHGCMYLSRRTNVFCLVFK